MTPEPPVPIAVHVAALPTGRRIALPANTAAALLTGAAAGALWGIVARGWMRFISAELEFSWGGTIAIVIIFALFGFGQAVAAVVRRSGRRQRAQIAGRTVAIATTLPMGMAAGSIMLPFILLAAIAGGRTGMHPVGRLALAALAVIPTLLVLRQLLEDLTVGRAIAGWALMFVIYLPLVWWLSLAMRPFPPREPGAVV